MGGGKINLIGMFRKLTIGPQLLIFFGIIMALILAVAGVSFWQAAAVVADVSELLDPASSADSAAAVAFLNQSLRRLLFLLGGLTVTATLIVTSLVYVLFHSITDPLGRLYRSARRWSQGSISHRIRIDQDNEFGQLASVLNQAAERQQNWANILEKTMTEHSRELEHRAFHLETSVAIAQRITSILDSGSLLQQVTELIRQRYNLSYVGLFLATRSGHHLTLQASTRPKADRSTLQIPIGEHSLIGWVAHHRRPGLSSNLLEDDTLNSEIKGNIISLSELALPLTIGRNLVGVLDLHSDQPAAFAREDLPMYQSLADQVAIAIKNSTIYESEQSGRQLSETLQKVGQELNSTLNFGEVQELILQSTRNILPYDMVTISLLDGSSLSLGAQLQTNEGLARPEFPPLDIDQTPPSFPIRQLVEKKEPVVVQDIAAADWLDVPGLPQSGSWLGVPLIHEGEPRGVLSLLRNVPYGIGDQDVATATAIAAQATIALENARLYDQIKRFSEQLEYEVRRRTLALQTAYNQLEQLDEAKTNFIGIASHELRTPLTVLRGYSQILSKAPEILGNPQYATLVEGIISGTHRLQEIVDTMLDMARIENRSLTVLAEPINLFEIVADVRGSFEEALIERQITVEMSTSFRRLPPIHADFDGMCKVFTHLLTNAVKYTPDGGAVMVDGHAWESDPIDKSWPSKGVKFTVKDNGIGIEKENLAAIFDKFFQTGEVALHSSGKTKFKGGGPGLGLAIVRGIVEAHRGLVWAESDGYDEAARPGSTLHVVLPILHEPEREMLPTD